MQLIFTEETLKYRSAGHPESPERIKLTYQYLKDYYETIAPHHATKEDLLTAHEPEFVENVKEGNFSNPDCPHYPNLWHFATLSVGGAITAQERNGFSLMRPPGHHAGANFLGGFCYFNNLAVATKKSNLKTLIVDIDGHHGNGTQDIFLGDDQVHYLSLHRSYGFPGTGHRSRKNVINCPLEVNCGNEKYLSTLESALKKVTGEKFEQLAISAGFDTHSRDPLASLGLTRTVYKKIGKMLNNLNLPTFAVLEGGYIGKDMGPNIRSFLQGIE